MNMLSKKMEDAFNEQVNAELYSAYLYMSMSADLASKDLEGMATWMRLQAQEEVTHAMKIFDFIQERGGRANLTQIAAPGAEWSSPLAAFEAAYAHEQKVTGLIGKLVDLAQEEKDHASVAFLQWFVTEQVEEEATALGVVNRLTLAADHNGALLMIDKELGGRGTASSEA